MPPPGRPPVQNAVAVRPPREQETALAVNYNTIVETLKADRGAEARAIRAMFGGDKRLMDRFLSVCFASLQGNPKLVTDCDPLTIVQAIRDAAALGLEPTGLTGEAAIVPRGKIAVLQPMWRGYLKRIRNSGKVLDVDVQLVYMNDQFDLQLGTSPAIHHVPMLYGEKGNDEGYLAERGDFRGAYAWALMPSGLRIIEWMSTDDINEIRDRFSDSWKNLEKRANSPWATSWGEQARKTVVRRLAKRLPGEAVDSLLRLDAVADTVAAEAVEASREATAALSDVRRLALAATGTLPEPEAQGPSTEPGTPVAPGALLTSLSEELCNASSPFDPVLCVKAAGHPGNHQAADKSSWTS